MGRPRKNLGEMGSEVVQKNFLEEHPDEKELSTAEKVVVAKEVPPTETFVFMNNRDPGVPLLFHYASKTHPLKHYELIHGKQYTLPREVVLHLSGENPSDLYACHRRQYEMRRKPDGKGTECVVSGYIPDYQCKPVRA